MSRTISTRLAIEGESEYKQSITNISSALLDHKAKLNAVKAEYRDSANTMDALRAKSEALRAVQEAQTAKVKEVSAALENARKAQQQYAAKVEECRAKVAAGGDALEEYQKELDKAERYQEAAQRGVYGWQKQLESATKAVNKTNAELKQCDHYLDEAKKSTDGCATSIDQYGKKVKKAGDDSAQFGRKSAGAVDTLASALVAAGVAATLKEIAQAIRACVDASVEFESAVAGVFKTVDGTETQLATITDGIRQMSTQLPASTTEIAAVAEAAGQLGIKTDDVLNFTRVMLDLGQSTNLSANEAASALAKFANITGTAAEDYSRLGSAIVGLGNNFATTEADIVNMATRLASTGSLTGLTEAQILALSTTLSSLGIEAEAGGTALSKLLKEFEVMVATGSAGLEDFSKVAGMSAEAFSTAWKQDAVGALSAFISGLGRVQDAGGSAVATLQSLGVTEVRMSNAVLAMASSGDLLTNAINLSNQAWAENTALTDEAGKRYETTESKVAMLANSFTNVQAAAGDALTPALREISEAGTEAFQWAEAFIRENPALIQVLTALTVGLGVLTVGVVGYTAAVNLAKVASAAFTAAAGATALPFIAVAAALATLVTAIGLFTSASDDANKKLRETVEASEKATERIREDTAAKQANLDAVRDLLPQIDDLNSKTNRTSEEQHRLNGLVEVANSLYPGLIGQVDALTGSYDINRQSVEETIEAMKRQFELEANQSIIEESYRNIATLKQQRTDAEKEYVLALEAAKDAQEKFNAALSAQDTASMEGLAKTLHSNNLAVDSARASVEGYDSQIVVLTADVDALINANVDLAATTQDTENAAGGAAAAYDSFSAGLTAFTGVLEAVQGGYDLLSKAQKESEETGYLSISTISTLLEQYPELSIYLEETAGGYQLSEDALNRYISAQRAEYQVALNESKQAAIARINQENNETLAINATTEAIKLKLQALIAEARANASTSLSAMPKQDTMYGGSGYAKQVQENWLAAQAEYQKAAQDIKDYESALSQIEQAEAKLRASDRVTASLDRDSGGGSKKSGSRSSGGSKQEKTPEELDLDVYKAYVKDLDYQRNLDRISLAEYMEKKNALAERYLAADAEERRAWDVERYNYQQGAYSRDLEELDRQLQAQEITRDEYNTRAVTLQNKHLEQGSKAFLDAQEKNQAFQEESYQEELADQKYFLDMGIITETQYYVALLNAQEKYLTEGSDAWRKATLEQEKWKQQQREQSAADTYNALLAELDRNAKAYEEAQKRQEQAIKAATEARISAIKEEQAAEEARINALIDGIDQEIAARRRLRQEEGDQDKIAQAQKRLEAAQGILSMARTEAERAEAEKEVIRRQEDLDKAKQDKEDNDFYHQKEQEKAALQAQLEQAKAAYQDRIDRAEDEIRKEHMAAQGEANRAYNKAQAQKRREEAALQEAQGAVSAARGILTEAVQAAGTAFSQVTNTITKTASANVNISTSAQSAGGIQRAVERALDRTLRKL